MNKKKSVVTARLEPMPSRNGFTFESSALQSAISEVKELGLFQIYKRYITKGERVYVLICERYNSL